MADEDDDRRAWQIDVEALYPPAPIPHGYATFTRINRHGSQIELDFFHIPASEWQKYRKLDLGSIPKDQIPKVEAYLVSRVILPVEGFLMLKKHVDQIYKAIANPMWLKVLEDDIAGASAGKVSDEDGATEQ